MCPPHHWYRVYLGVSEDDLQCVLVCICVPHTIMGYTKHLAEGVDEDDIYFITHWLLCLLMAVHYRILCHLGSRSNTQR